MEYREEGRGPTLVMVQSTLGVKKLTQAIPALRDFPCLEVQSLNGDNDYPALNWQKMAAKHFVQQLLTAPGWLQVKRRERKRLEGRERGGEEVGGKEE